MGGDFMPVDEPGRRNLYAYFGGSDVLDLILYGRCDSAEATKRALEFLRQDFQTMLAYKASLAMRTIGVSDPKVALRLARLYQRHQLLEARRRERRTPYEVNIGANVEAFVQELNKSYAWATGMEHQFGRSTASAPPGNCRNEPVAGSLGTALAN